MNADTLLSLHFKKGGSDDKDAFDLKMAGCF